MKNFGFGQPDGGIIQIAYSVDDIDSAMADFGSRMKLGPWFVMGPFTPPGARYRGEPCEFVVTLAFAFSGNMQIELLQQHDDSPSALRERPRGFHHWGVGVSHFDTALAQTTALGEPVLFTDQAPDGGRFAYIDTSERLSGMIELIEMTPERDTMFTIMQQATMNWDGRDPIRRLDKGPQHDSPVSPK